MAPRSTNFVPVTNPHDPDMPLPLEIVDSATAMEAVIGPNGPTPFTPLGAAMLFWSAILHGRGEFIDILTVLTLRPEDWGDYSEVADELAGRGIMQHVDHPDGHEDTISYVRFIPSAGHTVRAFAETPLSDVLVLTLVRDGDIWKVWGYTQDHYPPPERVLSP